MADGMVDRFLEGRGAGFVEGNQDGMARPLGKTPLRVVTRHHAVSNEGDAVLALRKRLRSSASAKEQQDEPHRGRDCQRYVGRCLFSSVVSASWNGSGLPYIGLGRSVLPLLRLSLSFDMVPARPRDAAVRAHHAGSSAMRLFEWRSRPSGPARRTALLTAAPELLG